MNDNIIKDTLPVMKRCSDCGSKKLIIYSNNEIYKFITCKRCHTRSLFGKYTNFIFERIWTQDDKNIIVTYEVKRYYTQPNVGTLIYDSFGDSIKVNKLFDVHINNFHKIYDKIIRLGLLK